MAPRLVSGACWVFGSTILDFTFSVICIVLMLARVVRPPAVGVSAEEKAGSYGGWGPENRGARRAPGLSLFTAGGEKVSPPGLWGLVSVQQGEIFGPGGRHQFLIS